MSTHDAGAAQDMMVGTTQHKLSQLRFGLKASKSGAWSDTPLKLTDGVNPCQLI
jgi:hypothetical protein